MNKPLLILVFVAALAALAYVVFSDGTGSADELARREGATISLEPELGVDIDAAAEAPEFVDEESEQSGERFTLEPEADEQAIEAKALVVQVWDKKVGVPAVGAKVYFFEGRTRPNWREPFSAHWSTVAEDKGELFRSDARGRVSLPAVQRSAIVSAHAPGAFGILRLGRRHRKVETIVLQPDETLTVRVVDGQNRPVAGAPVGILQVIPRQGRGWPQLMARMRQLDQVAKDIEAHAKRNPKDREVVANRMRTIQSLQRELKMRMRDLKRVTAAKNKKAGKAGGDKRKPSKNAFKPLITTQKNVKVRARSDEQGLAIIRHFQLHRQNKADWWPAQHVDRFEAVLLAPLHEVVASAFAGRPAPSEAITLRMPPTGSVALRAVDLEGRDFAHPFAARLVAEGSKTPGWARVTLRRGKDDELLVFPFVGVGMRLIAECRLDDDDFSWKSPSFAGPSEAGQRVERKLVIAPGAGMLRGRMLDAEGKALAQTRLTFLINARSGRLEGEDIVCDDEGRFHLPYHVRDRHEAPFRLEIRQRGVRPTLGLSRQLPRIIPGRITDLGDLRIDAFARIAFGKVLDDRGRPIPSASVQLQREREVGRRQRRMAFVDEAFVATRSQRDGSYELYAALERGRYRLRVSARNHFPLETNGLRGGEEQTLRMTRRSKILGTVLTPKWLPNHAIRVVLESASDPKFRREDRIHDYRGKKYIHFDWQRPGTYSLTIRVRDFPGAVLRLGGITLSAGQMGVHPALANLDLTPHIHRFEISAIDTQGKAIRPNAPLLARILRSNGTSGLVGFVWRGSRCEIYARTPQLEVVPMAQGYRADPTRLSPGKSQLRFARIPRLILDASVLRERIGTTSAWVRLTLMEPSRTGLESWDQRSRRIAGWYSKLRNTGYSAVAQDGSARFAPMRDGRYAIEAWVGNKSKGVSPVRILLGSVDVRLVPGAQPSRTPIQVEASALDALMAQLNRNRQSAGRKR